MLRRSRASSKGRASGASAPPAAAPAAAAALPARYVVGAGRGAREEAPAALRESAASPAFSERTTNPQPEGGRTARGGGGGGGGGGKGASTGYASEEGGLPGEGSARADHKASAQNIKAKSSALSSVAKAMKG